MQTLASNPDLEASCARALDLEAPMRIAVIFQADDPVFLASSRGAMMSSLGILQEWGSKHKARLHVGADKSVVLVSGSPAGAAAISCAPPITVCQFGDESPTALTLASITKWLGLLWPADLRFSQAFFASIHAANGAYRSLADLVASKALPLALAVQLFEAKVDGILQFARWLFLEREFLSAASDCFARWAVGLLGGGHGGTPPWQPGCWVGDLVAATGSSARSPSVGPK